MKHKSEPHYIPPGPLWKRFILVSACCRCGQVASVVVLPKDQDEVYVPLERGFLVPCPNCGHGSRRVCGKGFYNYDHLLIGPAIFHSSERWWAPWTWGTGYWQLSRELADRIQGFGPLRRVMLAVEGG